jgi:cytochrome c-type biogenesis protein
MLTWRVQMKKLFIFGIAMILMMTVLAGCTEDDNGDEEEEEELELAQDFTLTDIDGNTFSLSDYEGKVVVLDFMATWCIPCQEGMDDLKKVFNNYDDSKVVIITIDADEEENDTQLRNFKDTYGDEWIYAVDYNNDADAKYNVTGYPTLFIINKKSEIAYMNDKGSADYSTLKTEIDKLL